MPVDANLVLLPSPEHLALTNVLIVLVSLIHLPYIGLVLGSVFFSIFFGFLGQAERSKDYLRLSQQLAQLAFGRFSALLVLGLIPQVVLLLSFPQLLYKAQIPIFSYFLFITLAGSVGLVLLYLYSLSMKEPGPVGPTNLVLGLFGYLPTFSAYFVLVSTTAILLSPEAWTLIRTPVPMFFSWNVVARLLVFLLLCFAMTGVGLLFFRFRWEQEEKRDLSEYENLVRQFGAGLGLASILVLPVMVVWTLHTTPLVALSEAVYGLYGIAMLVLILVATSLYRVLVKRRLRSSTGAFVSLVLVLLLVITVDQVARENALREHNRVVAAEAEAYRIEAEEKIGLGGGGEPNLQLGEEIFSNRCATCHAFDHKVVGPSYRETLPKYKNDLETLKSFVKSPWKVRQDYPPMPALGLRAREIDSVVLYLMERLEKESAGVAPFGRSQA